MAPNGSMKGSLLAAAPMLTDPNFDRGVVFLLDHGEDGALGIILNRPSGLDVEDPLPEWQRFASEPGVVFVGGPVSRNAVIALAQVDQTLPEGAWEQVLGAVGVLDLSIDPDDVAAAIGTMRVFAGYAGWGPGQLEAEIDEGAWFVVDAEADDAFTPDPDHLWTRVLARQGGRLALVARIPPDLSAN